MSELNVGAQLRPSGGQFTIEVCEAMSVDRVHRPLIMGLHGAVAANHPLAAQAGVDVLKRGGKAVDAAVAVSLALGVVEPAMSGLGADGFFHIYAAAEKRSEVFNGSGPAPKRASRAMFASGLPESGPLSVSLPGKLAALGCMHDRHGSVAWEELVRPAIEIAERGFGATRVFCEFAEDARMRLKEDPRSAARFLGKSPGDILVNPDLALSLRMIACDGWQTFYRGRLADRLITAFEDVGVLIGRDDLAEFHCEITAPISMNYRGLEIHQTGPNSTGFTMLQILKILENFDFRGLSRTDQIHVTVEAKKLAFIDRDRFSTDPRFGEIPLEHLLSSAYAQHLASRIDLGRAADVPIGRARLNSDTTYFCVVDGEGNAVSAIQSNASTFGSGVTAGDTGIVLNNRLGWWELDPRLANALEPGKRISHTMNAPLVFEDGRLWGVLGTPGADNQVQVNVQMLTAMADLELDPQAAAERPRWISSQRGQGVAWRNVGDGRLAIERDVGKDVMAGLESRGHVLDILPHLGGACAAGAIRVLSNGMRMAGSDPRRDGWAAAY